MICLIFNCLYFALIYFIKRPKIHLFLRDVASRARFFYKQVLITEFSIFFDEVVAGLGNLTYFCKTILN